MKIKDAVAQRIIDLCKEKNIAINALGNISGVNPSTIYSILNTKSQNPGVVTLQKICDGLEISIRDFFDVELFDDIEQEIILKRTDCICRRSVTLAYSYRPAWVR